MGDAVILGQLHHLGVDEQQLHVLRAGAEQQAHDDAVHAHGFTAAGAARDEQVGHLAQVGHLRYTGNVLAKGDAQRRGHAQKALALKDAADGNGGLAGDGGFHTHVRHRKVQGDIVCQRGDAADLHTRHGLQFVSGNRGPAGDIQHPGAHAEAFQRVHQLLGVGLQLLLCAGVALLLRFFKQLDGRVLVLVAVHRLGLLGGGGGGCLLRDSGLFHGRCHQRVDVLFLHRLGGDADPAVLVRRRAERHGILGAHPGHGGLDRRSLRLRGHLRLHHRRCRLDDGRIKSGGRGRLFRLGGIFGKEICRRGDYRVCHDGRLRGLGCRAQRVLPEGAARPDDQRLNGLAAALGEGGVVGAKVYVKGRAGMGNADPHRGDGRRGRLRLGKGGGCSLSFGSVCLHLLRYLVSPAQHAGHPVRHP